MIMKKILIIDDEYSIREMYKTIFTDLGYATETAKNGLDALGKLPGFRPDAILLDVSMPEMNGPEFAKRLHEHPEPEFNKLPFVVLTGDDYSNVSTQYLFRGNPSCKAFLPKMADPDMVVRVIQSIIEPNNATDTPAAPAT
ncbi:MAG: hypothetical protein A2234_04515 [Elusimicrobia bacterium RIFOXYA2_FULL_58_8]|nr:MAG: hypothetical protein A2285_03705 [Elusimicrobia bacterium RIFOXYA12_FULL_57_11]OGS15518.1 MAG: hypothetical protein A2234_04515 [Elusimicrobia bacterium RIFOXYA2_FULL_58_8]